MVSMYRNTNLEEIKTDALFGFDFFMYQTMWQKALLIIGVVLAVGINVFCMFFLDINSIFALLLCIPIVLPCILFGCNYNQDLTLVKYLLIEFKEPAVKLILHSSEQVSNIRSKATELSDINIDDTDSTKPVSFKKIIILGVSFAILLVVVILFKVLTKSDGDMLHHTV